MSPVFTIDPLSKYDFSKYEDREDYVKALVAQYSAIYGVSSEKMWNTLKCENTSLIFDLKSSQRYTKNHPEWGVKAGEQEKSFGLVQIHLPDHPEVSYEESIDPEFSVNFIARYFSKGKQNQWSCYKLLYN